MPGGQASAEAEERAVARVEDTETVVKPPGAVFLWCLLDPFGVLDPFFGTLVWFPKLGNPRGRRFFYLLGFPSMGNQGTRGGCVWPLLSARLGTPRRNQLKHRSCLLHTATSQPTLGVRGSESLLHSLPGRILQGTLCGFWLASDLAV